MMMFWSKTFKIKDHFIVAICDRKLLGRNIKLKNYTMKVNRIFYGGELIDEGKALKLMEKATMGNILGEKIVDLAIEHNFIAEENVIHVGDIPHAQFLQ